MPAYLQFTPPVTLAMGFRVVATTNDANMFGLYATSSLSFASFSFNGGILSFRSVNGASSAIGNTAFTPTAGVDYIAVGSATATGWTVYVYTGGALVFSQSGSWTTAAPTVSSPSMGFGYVIGSTSPCNCAFFFGGVYNRALSSTEASTWGRNPWGIFTPPSRSSMLTSDVSFTVLPTTIPADHSGNITLTLVGEGMSWDGSTTFADSGVSGTSIASQNVVSGTSATVDVATGSGTGALVISDGTRNATNTVTVATPTLAISPSIASYGVPTSIAVTGTNTLWTTETASTLFSTPGLHGDSISSIVVHSDTSATFTLNPGTATGSLVITDNSCATTSTYTIVGPTSLRVVGNWNVKTGTNSLLQSQSVASYSFFVKVNAILSPYTFYGEMIGNSGRLLGVGGSAGQLVFGYMDSTSGYTVQYTQNFTPGQIYHVALVWNSGVQTIYVNGIATATFSDANNTTSTSGKLFVGWGSSTSPIDYCVSNLAIWNGYALTQPDILSLRNGTITPLQVNSGSNPATSWWTLYGPIGDLPSLTPNTVDSIGFKDLGSGGNPFTTFSTTPTSALAYYDQGARLHASDHADALCRQERAGP